MKYFAKEYPDHVKGAVLDDYLARGWFRMRSSIFTTTHIISRQETNLHRVWWLRYRIDDLMPHRSHVRIRRNHRGFRVLYDPQYFPSLEDKRLFDHYRSAIRFEHFSSIQECLYTGEKYSVFDTHAIRVYDGHRLIGLSVFDTGRDSGAAILQAYDPAGRWMSPGKYLMLLIIDRLRETGYHFYYPGYIIAGDTHMDYKLFPGREAAFYHDPVLKLWRPFHKDVLQPEQHDEDEVYDFYWWMMGWKREM